MSVNCLFFDKNSDLKISIISIIIIFVFCTLLFISIFCKFDFITSYNGIVVLEDDFYLYLLLDNNEIVDIKKQNLVVDKKIVDFNIVKIDSDYVLTDSGPKKGVYLNFELNESDKIINNVISVKFVSKKTILDKMKEKFV